MRASILRSCFGRYPLENYHFGSNNPQYEKDSSVANRMMRLREEYEQFGKWMPDGARNPVTPLRRGVWPLSV